jgi:lipopolysaccharide biosynthesis glycosyltransferase
MNSKRICISLAFDTKFFQQAVECIKTIQQNCTHAADICVLGINLKNMQIERLSHKGVLFRTDYHHLPKYRDDFPVHAYTQLCRPYLRELFPGYDIYMWIDADIRIFHPDAFDAFLGGALAEPSSIAICQEADPLYSIVNHPQSAYGYHTMIKNRIEAVYGKKVGENLCYFNNFNTGIWAMHTQSQIWNGFQKTMGQALMYSYDHMREQDAMNIAVFYSGQEPVILPSTMNWLCSLTKPPKYDPETQRFVRPGPPQVPISVMHLICSGSEMTYNGTKMKWYDFYKLINLTA